MEQTDKQKAIETAYGKFYDKQHTDLNGFIDSKDLSFEKMGLKFEDIEHLTMIDVWRPKTLNGIETNNGWIRIESESDLPKEECQCFIIVKGEVFFDYYNGNDFDLYVKSYVTHYQPITKPKPPIY